MVSHRTIRGSYLKALKYDLIKPRYPATSRIHQTENISLWQAALIYVHDARTGAEIEILSGHTGSVNSVAFSHSGHTLASGSNDNTVRLWDAHTGKQRLLLKGHKAPILSVTFSPTKFTLAWMELSSYGMPSRVNAYSPLSTPVGLNRAFSPYGGLVASGNWDGKIQLWYVQTGTLWCTLETRMG